MKSNILIVSIVAIAIWIVTGGGHYKVVTDGKSYSIQLHMMRVFWLPAWNQHWDYNTASNTAYELNNRRSWRTVE